MNENETVVVDPNNPEKTENNEPDLDLVIELEDTDDVEALKKKVQTLQAQKDHWKGKATKPPEEKVIKEVAKVETTEKKDDLSTSDLFALMRANVNEEDVSEIVEYAKLKKISVPEALKSNVIKTILSEKTEERKTATASNTGKAKSSSTKMSDDDLLRNAEKGIFPESDADIERLVLARRNRK